MTSVEPAAETTATIVLREARAGDAAAIARLLAANGMTAPAHPGGSVWVLESASGAIVGHLASHRLTYRLDGQLLSTACASTWAVDPSCRGHSLLLIAAFLKQQGVDLFLNTTARHPVGEIFGGFRFRKVPTPYYDQALFWILDSTGFARSVLRKKNFGALGFLSAPLGAALSVIEAARGARGPAASSSALNGLRWLTSFGPEFDEFWTELSRRKQGVLLGLRDRAALSSHFQRALDEGRAWLLGSFDGGRLVGYSIFFRQDHPAFGLKRVRLADVQSVAATDEETHALLTAMLATAIGKFRGERFDMLEAIGFGPKIRAQLEAIAPHRRQLEDWPYYYKAASPALAQTLAAPERWEPSLFDGDATL